MADTLTAFETAMRPVAMVFAKFVLKDISMALLVMALAMLGWGVSLRASLNFAGFMYRHFLRPGVKPARFGPWAVVTGATDGIGKGYCQALAKRGINLVIISRTESKLRDFAAELERDFKVEVKFVAADLSAMTDAKWAEIETTIAPLAVGLLINNAGLSYACAEFTAEVSDKDMRDMVEINVISMTKMCKVVLPGMKERKRGFIVNMGSASGLIPTCPLLSIYAGTKAYVDKFTCAVASEYAQYGIHVQNQAPFFVATKMAKIRKARFDAPSVEKYVEAGLDAVGRDITSVSYWVHDVMYNAVSTLPLPLSEKIVYDMHATMRSKYLAKKAKEAKAQ